MLRIIQGMSKTWESDFLSIQSYRKIASASEHSLLRGKMKSA